MIFELISLMIAVPLCYLFAKWVHFSDYPLNEHKMYMLFAKYWDGKPESEIQAWREVQHFLITKSAHIKELYFAESMIKQLQKQQKPKRVYPVKNVRFIKSELE